MGETPRSEEDPFTKKEDEELIKKGFSPEEIWKARNNKREADIKKLGLSPEATDEEIEKAKGAPFDLADPEEEK